MGATFFFFFLGPPGQGRAYAIVSAVHAMSESPNCRYSVMLDGVDADWFDEQTVVEDIPLKHLALMRIVTTKRKLTELSDRGDLPREGEWLELNLSTSPGEGPPIWVYGAAGDYAESRRGSVIELTFRNAGEEPTEAGAAVAPAMRAGHRLRQQFDLSQFGRTKRSVIKGELTRFKNITRCVVHDVGQANLCRLENNDQCAAFVDIGEPVAFHARTMPARPHVPVPEDGLVIITHWDWDHVAAGRERPGLPPNPYANLKWIAPVQILGPNIFERIAKPHYRRGKLLLISVQRKRIRGGALQLLFGNGRDQNNSGLAIVARLGRRRVLLPGDASLDGQGVNVRGCFGAVVVPHHGAANCGLPPMPFREASGSKSIAAVSVGRANKYGHPDQITLKRYRCRGWSVVRTDQNGGRRRRVVGDINIMI